MIDTTISPAARPARASFIHLFAERAMRALKNARNKRRLRQTTRTLHRLSDHSLRDIGLERDNIEPMVRSRCSWL